MRDEFEIYNDLVPLMNNLIDENYSVYAHHNRTSGYGFYIDNKNNHYVEVRIWKDYIRENSDLVLKAYAKVHLLKRCTKYGHDCVNDEELRVSPQIFDTKEIETTINQYLKEIEGLNA